MRAGDICTNTESGSDMNIKELLDQQQVSLRNYFDQKLFIQFQNFEARISSALQTSICSITNELQKLNSQTSRLEDCCYTAIREAQDAKQQVESLSERVLSISREIEEKIDRLESFSRRDNLRFFNVPQAHEESYEECARTALNIIKEAVPEIKWHQDDISRAHRIGKFSAGQTRSKTLIVKFARWSDKMVVLNRGRENLRQKGISVANDLTDRQRQTVEEHRRQGLRAYYKGNRLVVAGPLRGRSDYARPSSAENTYEHHAVRHPHYTFRERSGGTHSHSQSISMQGTEQDYQPWSTHHFPMLPRHEEEHSAGPTSMPHRTAYSEPSNHSRCSLDTDIPQTTAAVLDEDDNDNAIEDSSPTAHDQPVRPLEGSSPTRNYQPSDSDSVPTEMLLPPTSPPPPQSSDSDIQVSPRDHFSTTDSNIDHDTTECSLPLNDSRADLDTVPVTNRPTIIAENNVQPTNVQPTKRKTQDKTSRRLRSTSVPSTCNKRQTTITEAVSKPHEKPKSVGK